MTNPHDLKGLSERATPGEWHFEALADNEPPGFYICHPDTRCDASTVASMEFADGSALTHAAVAEANAALICAAVNGIRDGSLGVRELQARLREIDEVASNCVTADCYSANDALFDVQQIRRITTQALKGDT